MSVDLTRWEYPAGVESCVESSVVGIGIAFKDDALSRVQNVSDRPQVVVVFEDEHSHVISVGGPLRNSQWVPDEVSLVHDLERVGEVLVPLPKVNPVPVRVELLQRRMRKVFHFKLLGELFCQLRLAHGMSTVNNDDLGIFIESGQSSVVDVVEGVEVLFQVGERRWLVFLFPKCFANQSSCWMDKRIMSESLRQKSTD